MSGLRWITCWGNKGALRAFGKGFVLRNAFRGKPIGPFVLGPLGLKLKGKRRALRIAWGAARASCVLWSVPKSKLMEGPAMSDLWRISRWVRVVLGATCKKTEFSAVKD